MSKSNKHHDVWPTSATYAQRFRVPDLVPPKSEIPKLRAIFIGESPHRDEVAPEDAAERSPFRGVAGRDWWTALAQFMKRPILARPVPPRGILEDVCVELRIALMNAVQFPIDPKITLHQGDESAPREKLGFEKGAGEFGYKAVIKEEADHNPVRIAIADLALRLTLLGNSRAQVVCLGGDSRWFVERALEALPAASGLREKPLLTIPHPSSWWRNAAYKARAVDALQTLLSPRTTIRRVPGDPGRP